MRSGATRCSTTLPNAAPGSRHKLPASLHQPPAYFKLYELFIARAFEWVLSNEILTEYEEQVTRRYSVRTAQQVHDVLTTAPNAYFQEAYYKWQLIEADPDDNEFVDVAVAAGADFLVSNDRHFQPLRHLSFPRLPLVPTRVSSCFLARKSPASAPPTGLFIRADTLPRRR